MIRGALDALSLWAMPVLLVLIPLVGILRGVKVYDVFIEQGLRARGEPPAPDIEVKGEVAEERP